MGRAGSLGETADCDTRGSVNWEQEQRLEDLEYIGARWMDICFSSAYPALDRAQADGKPLQLAHTLTWLRWEVDKGYRCCINDCQRWILFGKI